MKRELASLPFRRLKDLKPICLFSVDSTQDYLATHLQSKREGDFVLSDLQTSGKGREGRAWFSDRGGLYLSITLVPKGSAEAIGRIAPVVTDSIMKTFESDFHLAGCSLKAPNDVICRGKKIAGVLVDAKIGGGEEGGVAYVGIGVDLNNGEEWGEEMHRIATSYLLETGNEISIDEFVVRLLTRLDLAYDRLLC